MSEAFCLIIYTALCSFSKACGMALLAYDEFCDAQYTFFHSFFLFALVGRLALLPSFVRPMYAV